MICSLSPNPDLTLLNNPTVEVVVKLPGEAEYVVKLNGSPHWVKLAPEEQLSVDIAADWQMRAAGPSDKAVRTMQASVIDEAQLQTVLAKQEHIVLEASNGGKPVLQISPDKAPDGIRIVELDDGGTRISMGSAAVRQHPSRRSGPERCRHHRHRAAARSG